MTKPLAVVGAGGFGREVIDVVRAINANEDAPIWDLRGVVDDAPSDADLQRLKALEIPYLGPLSGYVRTAVDAVVAVGVGSPEARRSVVSRLQEAGLASPVLIHPSAVLGSLFECGDGSVICAGVSIGTNTRIGRHVHLNPHAVMGHDVTTDDYVSVNPNATVSGEVHLNADCLVGAGALILQGLTVGAGAWIGGGACVVRSVAERSVVAGVPARELRRR